MADLHRPVLLDAALARLAPRPSGVYIDATFGRGGHARGLLERLGPTAHVIALDHDPGAAPEAERLASVDARFEFVGTSFAELDAVLAARALAGRVNGLLFDLGVSSPQLETAVRGLSFNRGGPLDMRMNPSAGRPLADWLAVADDGEIARVLRRFGEEPQAGRIARAIVAARERGGLGDSVWLADVVKQAVPARVARGQKIHPATRTFQAFRIFINDELNTLDAGLAAGLRALAPGGRLAVISFHSLEDRRAKRALKAQAQPRQPPVPMAPAIAPALRLIGPPVTAGAAEIAANPRARSAVLRVAERTAAPLVAS